MIRNEGTIAAGMAADGSAVDLLVDSSGAIQMINNPQSQVELVFDQSAFAVETPDGGFPAKLWKVGDRVQEVVLGGGAFYFGGPSSYTDMINPANGQLIGIYPNYATSTYQTAYPNRLVDQLDSSKHSWVVQVNTNEPYQSTPNTVPNLMQAGCIGNKNGFEIGNANYANGELFWVKMPQIALDLIKQGYDPDVQCSATVLHDLFLDPSDAIIVSNGAYRVKYQTRGQLAVGFIPHYVGYKDDKLYFRVEGFAMGQPQTMPGHDAPSTGYMNGWFSLDRLPEVMSNNPNNIMQSDTRGYIVGVNFSVKMVKFIR